MAAPAQIIGEWETNNFTVNSIDLTDYVKDFVVKAGRRMREVPSTSDPYAKYLGLDTSELTANFYATYYTALVNETLQAAWSAKTIFTVTGRPTSAVIGTTNRGFSGSFVLAEYTHIDWEMLGEAASPVVFLQAGEITFPSA